MRILISTLLVGLSFLWGETPPPEYCPLVNIQEFNELARQKVEIVTPKDWKLGENYIHFILEKKVLPSGYIVAGYADIFSFEGDTPPSVVDGYPKTTITLHESGSYRFELKLNLIYKGS
ncbi:MAG: hypothetical protein GX780_04110 [Campylobacteraceae bacterium]|nr:hypothetical protein [Campylobacteraceae bacterium]